MYDVLSKYHDVLQQSNVFCLFLSFLFGVTRSLCMPSLPLHAIAEAYLTGWPNAQPQGRDYCGVARHH